MVATDLGLGGISILLSVVEYVVALGSFILVLGVYRHYRAAPLKNALLAFLMISIGSLGIVMRRSLFPLEQHAAAPYLYLLDFGYLFAMVYLYKALVR